MTQGVTFQTRARAIDHLGRGQIADTPTAVSELWKNAYDAYARSVTLHVFDGAPVSAAVFDDGVGMNRSDVIDRWLVIGTESKVGDDAADVPVETFGLPQRVRQGEKGIGRLSVAFLAPVTLLVAKRVGSPYVAVLVDWRLFENPFIALNDVRLPVEEFDNPAQALPLLHTMASVLRSNLGADAPPPDADERSFTVEEARAARLQRGWARFREYERKLPNYVRDTDAAITDTWAASPIEARHLDEWPVFAGLWEHGTALFLVGVHHELAVWARPESEQDVEAAHVRERLRETLTAFTDPFADPRPPFDYEVAVHRGTRYERVLATDNVFGRDDLLALEHYVDGAFDDRGVFRGRIVVFGQDRGPYEYVPDRLPPTSGRERVGPFRFAIGTFEQDPKNTTHSLEQFAHFSELADLYGGVTVYRDGLRVMPYGRPQSDFFNIEERRGRHAGRFFWAHRRSFGRVAFTRHGNPNLRDKAGREGLVENRANRELRLLVIDVLVDVARRYFGTDAAIRKGELPELQKRNEAARASAERARVRRQRNVRQFLREQEIPLNAARAEAERLVADAERARTTRDRDAATVISARYRDLLTVRSSLRPPPIPGRRADTEDAYRAYRDRYREFAAQLDDLGRLSTEIEADIGTTSPDEVARRSFASHQSALTARVDSYLKRIETRTDDLRGIWRGRGVADRADYYKRCHELLERVAEGSTLGPLLNRLDAERRELEATFADRYEPFLQSLDQLVEGIDIESALAVVEDDRSALEERVRNLNAVAQIGITVEIVGHELEILDAEVRRNLLRLPDETRRSTAYKLAYEAHSALADRLRFLAPLKIAGYRSRETITGAQIADYVGEFFARTFRSNRIDFAATPAFRVLRIVDLASRVFPVFLNLVNNAVYWASQSVERQIRLDFVDGLVVVADSGRGVDPDDVPRLFELFFTRRRDGRGVGLYLSRANLAVARHTIRYARDDDPHVLGGANFIIDFRGVTTDA